MEDTSDNKPRTAIQALNKHAQLKTLDTRIASPGIYWQAVMKKTNSKSIDPLTDPEWAKDLELLQTKGDYLRAMRHALGLTLEDVARELNLNPVKIDKTEAMSFKGDRILDFYNKTLSSYYALQTELFDPDIFARLSSEPALENCAKQPDGYRR